MHKKDQIQLLLIFLCLQSQVTAFSQPDTLATGPVGVVYRCHHQSTNLFSLPPRRAFEGKPSSPGWKDGQLDRLTDWAVNEEANRPVICEYEPDALWLWTKWRGTVLSMTYSAVMLSMGMGVLVDRAVHSFATSTWPLLGVPPADDELIQQLHGLSSLWEYQLTLSTFILTFFTSQAYNHWRSVYLTTRAIQGRVNDVCLLLAISAQRSGESQTQYREDSRELVRTCTRLLRLSHTFFWAATPTCSNGVGDGGISDGDQNSDLPMEQRQDNAIGPLLLSPEGLRGLQEVNELTEQEVQALLQSGLPPSQYTYILLEWAGLYVVQGLESGLLRGTAGVEENFLRQLTSLRAEYFSIGDFAAGRMPLAYVQLLQVLVDSLVALAPFSLYSKLGSLSILLTGLLTLFFKGLLELSKSFLDPFGNEGYPGQNVRVDVLVSELNFGASSRWVKGAETLPELSKMATEARVTNEAIMELMASASDD